MAKIIDGKKIAEEIKLEAKEKAQKLINMGILPCLAVILVGDDPASKVYVANKKRACEALGIKSLEYLLPEDTAEDEIISLIEKLNADSSVNGILCQLPLPKGINEKKVTSAILPEKDVDGFHPVNVGKMMYGEKCLRPCTPAGIVKLLERENIDICGKKCVVVGRSNIVGKPVAVLMLSKNATVTVCHSKTVDLKAECLSADIIICAVGKPNFLTADMVKKGAVVIDVGISRLADKKLCGDVDFENVEPIASAITPVPGGVGPMTIAMLMSNTVRATKMQRLPEGESL